MQTAPETMTAITLSTEHIDFGSVSYLENYVNRNNYFEYANIVVYPKQDNGWFIYLMTDDIVSDPQKLFTMPPALLLCVAYAQFIGAELLILDNDGPVMANLPTYDD